MEKYEKLTLDEERALYGISNAEVLSCDFLGAADGESALKETKDLTIKDCRFELRYPMWHLTNGRVEECVLTESCRAPLWYDRNVELRECEIRGVKALRECDASTIAYCNIDSTEFGWFCRGIKLGSSSLTSEYPFLQTRDMDIVDLKMKGKYSFQYTENVTIRDSVLETKDAFWHGKNITVVDSIIKGEYLAWYSENIRFVRCKIIGTQPLCYCKGLVLEDCEMEGADLAFENSDVNATVKGHIISVKNPLSGSIKADSIGEIILEHPTACAIN